MHAFNDEDDGPRKPLDLHTHRERNTSSPKWLVKRLIPETGIGLISGQWGTGKTANIVDLGAALCAGNGTFAGLPIKRQGVMLLFALEGSGVIQSRLEAVSKEKYGGNLVRIYYSEEQIKLLRGAKVDKVGVARVLEYARDVHRAATRDLRLPLVCIAFDTLIRAAGYNGEGSEQDSVIGAAIMEAFSLIAKPTGTVVLAADHYGKNVGTGTRGSSAKEDASDFILALLGDRDESGKMSNRRMVVRKLRSGAAGADYPYDLKVVDTGLDEDGEPDSSITVDWNAAPRLKLKPVSTRKQNEVRSILTDLIAEGHGEMRSPRADMQPVKCVTLKTFRREFYRRYVSSGDEDDPAKIQDARRKACNRTIKAAVKANVIGFLDDRLWLAT